MDDEFCVGLIPRQQLPKAIATLQKDVELSVSLLQQQNRVLLRTLVRLDCLLSSACPKDPFDWALEHLKFLPRYCLNSEASFIKYVYMLIYMPRMRFDLNLAIYAFQASKASGDGPLYSDGDRLVFGGGNFSR